MTARASLRRLAAGGALSCALALACKGAPAGRAAGGLPYLDDASFRRAALHASLVNPDSGYARLREAHYATGADGDWDRLPEWNPEVAPVRPDELGASPAPLRDARALALPAPRGEDDPALVELGRLAFSRYPVQPAPYVGVALGSREAAASFGLWVDDARGVAALVRARMADGSSAVSLTCASCHTASLGGALVDGLPNARLDLGAMIVASARGEGRALDAVGAWGRGRIDVSSRDGLEPARIPDLRPVAWLTHLQQDATVRAPDLTALAVRIETLVITSQGELVRPPRVVALALAAYVKSLARGLPSADEAAARAPAGRAIFDARCASCHAPPGFTGRPVSLERIGTDDTLGRSPDRGTGAYRVPSLRGVGTRGPLLHDGSLPSLAALFDPERTGAGYQGRLHGAGPVRGHAFGLDLDDPGRAALVAYLRAL